MTCPNGCIIRWTDDDEKKHERPAFLKKRGKRLFCRVCGTIVNRARMLIKRMET